MPSLLYLWMQLSRFVYKLV